MFSDVSDLIARNAPGLHGGVAVADLDGDGRCEFVVAGSSGPNRVLRWVGGSLRDVAPPELADGEQSAVGIAAGDLDGDGREELYVLNADTVGGTRRSPDRLFKAGPDGHWEDLLARSEHLQLRNRTDGRGVAVIDRRGVGRYGFLVVNRGRPARLYEAGPEGALADLAPPLGLDRPAGGRGVVTLPLFSSHPDIVCVNEQGPNFVYRNRSDGTFVESAAGSGLCDAGEAGRGVTVFDGGGGDFGLSWGNWDGPHRAMARSGNTTWKDAATPALALPSAVRTVIAADFDNDGYDELFFQNIGESNRLFRVSNPEGGRGESPPEFTMLDPGAALDPTGFGTGAAVCDVDGDGVLELLVARGERGPQPLGIYKVRGAEGQNWLRVRPLTRFNAPARGAVVRAEVGGRVRVKGVCGGSGSVCQMEPTAHFGLGPHVRVDRIQVAWPDGSTVVLLNPGVNRTVTVPYPRG